MQPPFEREEQRYEYPLTKDSVVIDVGAFCGQWATEINKRYGCKVHAFEPVFIRECRSAFEGNDNIILYCVALSGIDKDSVFGVQGNMTGAFSQSTDKELIPCCGVDTAWRKLKLDRVDLMKLNVEGMEFEIIDGLCDTGLIEKVEYLQVQYHCVIKDFDSEIERIEKRLSRTHEIEWGTDKLFWTSYRRKDIPKTPSTEYRNSGLRSRSQAGQDLFVHRVMRGKIGTFLDIGCSHPVEKNNTFALEQIGWTGTLVDIDCNVEPLVRNSGRKAKFICGNALQIDWNSVVDGGKIDYLSLDIDQASLDCLKRLPTDRVRFGVITIEHDAYRNGDSLRTEMRHILKRLGYVLIASDVKDCDLEFEDWWVSKDLESSAQFAVSQSKDWKEIVLP